MPHRKDKIKGLVYGAILGDAIAAPHKNKKYGPAYSTTYKSIEFCRGQDWTSVSDRLIVLADTIANSTNYINIFQYAETLVEWTKKGIIELPAKPEKHLSMHLNFVLKQKSFLENPLKSSKSSYQKMDCDSAPNDALACNAACGACADWYKNTILHTMMTTYDSRCVAACLVHSYIINCIIRRQKIDWQYINPLCQKIITTTKLKKRQNLIEFHSHLNIALNYKNILTKHTIDEPSAFVECLRQLNIGNPEQNDNQSYVLTGMVIAIIIAIDIDYELINKRQPDTEYFSRRLREVASCGGDTTTNCSIVGSIIGAFIGFEALPSEWIQNMANQKGLDNKLQSYFNSV